VQRLTQQNSSLQKAVETFKHKMTEYEGRLCSQTDNAEVSTKKQQYEQQIHDKELKDLKTQIETLKKTKNTFEQKAAQSNLKEQEAQTQLLEARRQQQEEAKNVEKLRLEVQKSKDEVRRLQIDN
jgi:chromosome segregation ATPase